MEKTLQLIALYCTVADDYSTIQHVTQRLSNNFRPKFTDEECITVYLWGTMDRRFELKAVYDYAKEHYLDWFPKLPSYQRFCERLNMLAPAFQLMAEKWMDLVSARLGTEMAYVVDSCPIVLAKEKRSNRAKVAPGLCGKGYCSSRNEYYYGVKLHTFATRHTGTLPAPCSMMVSSASENDLTVARWIMEDCQPFRCGILYADKAYTDETWAASLKKEHSITILTPRKKKKYDTLQGGDAVSTFVSGLRQPIECFFSWLNEKTNIQTASKVRSFEGLLVHVFGKIAAALYLRYFNS